MEEGLRVYPLLPLPTVIPTGVTFWNSFPLRLEAICSGIGALGLICNAPKLTALALIAPPVLRTAAVVIEQLISLKIRPSSVSLAVDPNDSFEEMGFERENPLAFYPPDVNIPVIEDEVFVDDRILTQVGAPVKFRDAVFHVDFSLDVAGFSLATQPMQISREMFSFAMSQCKANITKEELIDKFQRLSIVSTPRKYENVYKDTAELCALALHKRPDFLGSLPNPNLRVLVMIDFIITVMCAVTTVSFTRFLLKNLKPSSTHAVSCLLHGVQIVGRWVAT